MKIEDIRELIQLMKENQIGEIDIQSEGERIRLKSQQHLANLLQAHAPLPQVHVGQAPPERMQLMGPEQPAPAEPAPAEETEAGEVITSPIVGIFYASSSPEKPPFVQVGDTVDEETVVCIIEAMKVMNEIKAEMRGKVRKVYVENGQPVEYGQPLFLIDPHA